MAGMLIIIIPVAEPNEAMLNGSLEALKCITRLATVPVNMPTRMSAIDWFFAEGLTTLNMSAYFVIS